MIYFQKMPYQIDVKDLNQQLGEHPELWGQYGWRKALGPHAQMTDIWVRYNDIAKFGGNPGPEFNDEHVPVWYPAWEALPALKPVIFNLMAQEQGEMLGAVLITKISAGQGIRKHVDRGWHVEYYDKFYVSLESAPGATFHCGEEVINPEVGDCWRFDNRREHWVENNSSSDRVTLIVCIRTEKYKRERHVFELLG